MAIAGGFERRRPDRRVVTYLGSKSEDVTVLQYKIHYITLQLIFAARF